MHPRLVGLCAGALFVACTQDLPLGRNASGVTPAQTAVIVAQDGTTATLDVELTGDAAGASAKLGIDQDTTRFGVSWWTSSTSGSTARITFTAARTSLPGDHPVTVTAKNALTQSTSPATPLTITVAIAAQVASARDPSLGVDGGLVEVVTTSLQPAIFQQHIPDVGALGALHPPHVHVQVYEAPWHGQTMDPQSDWSFDELNAFVKDLLTVGDGQPELQLTLPMKLSHTLDLTNTEDIKLYAEYCQHVVSYYNVGSFPYGTGVVQNPNLDRFKIHNWGILSDFNTNDRNTGHYVTVYDQAVMAMRQVDPSIAVSALEFTDDGETFRPAGALGYLNGFAAPADGGGVQQPVDSVSLHMYATASQGATVALGGVQDARLFAKVAQFREDLKTVRAALAARADLADTPIWVTQSNVNANYAMPGGVSSADQNSPFVNDPRGTGAFFAAWGPLMFSQLGQQGNAALSHWAYTSGHDPGDASVDLDIQNAEVNYDDAGKFLSYWVDKAMADAFPAGAVPDILPVTTTEATGPSAPATVDVLATRRSSGTVVVMVSDLAVADPENDINGDGLPRTVIVDLSALAGTAFSASQLVVDATTSRDVGPMPMSTLVPHDLRIPVSLPGYGVAFLTLTPIP